MNLYRTFVKKSWAIWSYKCVAVTKDSLCLELKKKNWAKENLRNLESLPIFSQASASLLHSVQFNNFEKVLVYIVLFIDYAN
jgi:hypothetical protein